MSGWMKRLTCRIYGHASRLRGPYVIECARCGIVIAPDPRDAARGKGADTNG